MTVYLAIVCVNDYIDDIIVFETLEKAENFKKEKDSFSPCCEIKVRVEQHYVR